MVSAHPENTVQSSLCLCAGLLDVTPAENNGTVGALYDMIDPDVVNDLPPGQNAVYNQLCLSIVLLYRHFVVLEGAMELKFAPVLFLLRCSFRWYPFVFLPPAESSSGEPGVLETCPFPTDPETYQERAFCADCICSSCQVVRHMLGFTACHLASYVLFPV